MALIYRVQSLILIFWIGHIGAQHAFVVGLWRSQRLYKRTRHMLGSPWWPTLFVPPVVQTLLAQHPRKLIRTQAAQIVNKILRHKYFFWVHGLAQQVFIHVSDSLFTQFRTLPQAMRPSLELRSAAFQQYSAKPTRAIHVTPCLLCANIEYKVNLTYLITPFGCPAMQAFIKSGFIQV